MKILMRGDCTSRRAVFYNKDLFGAGAKVVQNQKSPFVLFNDHARGVSATLEMVRPHIDVERMPPVLKSFFIGQFDRSIWQQPSADLLILDSYADMNFELYEGAEGTGKFWIHRAYLRDAGAFRQSFRLLGRRTLEQSVADAVEFIGRVRDKYGPIPVVFLNQQVEYYPKLHERREFYDLGRLVAERVANCEYGGSLQSEELELADVGSCGPGLTLHYTGPTYRKMLDRVALLGGAAAAPTAAATVTPPSAPAAVPAPVPMAEPNARSASVPIGPAAGTPAIPDPAGGAAEATGTDAGTLSISLRPPAGDPPYDRDQVFERFRHYFIIPEADVYEPRFLPAVIELERARDYEAWVKATKKEVGDNAFRNEKKAQQRGYVVEMFDRRTYIPDIHAINHSMPVRAGREMGAGYRRSIEELGGYPTSYREPRLPANKTYWVAMFGAFLREPGRKQGEVVTDRRLVGYVSVRRYADLILYPQVLGHGDHLLDGIMAQIHFHVLRWLLAPDCAHSAGARLLMYTAANAGNEGLRTWKKRAGFKPRRIQLVAY